jgi:hypothetical protein
MRLPSKSTGAQKSSARVPSPAIRGTCLHMNAQDALLTLRRYESALRARGIRHAAVFGSTARGENRPDSDLDIVVDIDPEMRMTVFDYVGLKEYIAGLFEGPVDVVSREGLKAYVRSAVAADAVYAF